MTNLRLSVCGIRDLDRHDLTAFSGIISVLDPDTTLPKQVAKEPPARRIQLHCHDVCEDIPGLVAPSETLVRELLDFGSMQRHTRANNVLIHCHLGVSRSTAAAYILLAQAHPNAASADLLRWVLKIRPVALPNLRIVALGDAQLNRGGELLAQVRNYLRLVGAFLT